MHYNTSRNYLSMREYGRHIQKMVEHLLTIEDKENLNLQTKTVIELMGTLNPHLRNVEHFRHMLWDHLFFISDFKLDVDSPYPIPEKTTYKAKTQPMGYPKKYPKHRHLGKNLELVINKALQEEDAEKKVNFANSIAYYMKLSYSNWHKELVQDDTIRTELNAITKGELEFSASPNIKHRNQPERSEFDVRNNNGRRQQNFGRNNNNNAAPRNGETRNAAGRNDNRTNNNNGNNRTNNTRTADTRNASAGSVRTNNNNNNRNFKKRF
jgi:Domain of unknown function (DUF4290)